MVIVTKMLYAMRFIVNNRQEPNGCLFLLFYGLRAVSISMGYIVMVEDNQGGGTMDLGATPVE